MFSSYFSTHKKNIHRSLYIDIIVGCILVYRMQFNKKMLLR